MDRSAGAALSGRWTTGGGRPGNDADEPHVLFPGCRGAEGAFAGGAGRGTAAGLGGERQSGAARRATKGTGSDAVLSAECQRLGRWAGVDRLVHALGPSESGEAAARKPTSEI